MLRSRPRETVRWNSVAYEDVYHLGLHNRAQELMAERAEQRARR
jgi:hypothetical protein